MIILYLILGILILIYSSLKCSDKQSIESFTNPLKLLKDKSECKIEGNKYLIYSSADTKTMNSYILANSCDTQILFSDGEWTLGDINFQIRNYKSNKRIDISFNGSKFEYYVNKDDPDKMVYYTVVYNTRLDKLLLDYIINRNNRRVKIQGLKDNNNLNKYNFFYDINKKEVASITLNNHKNDTGNKYEIVINDRSFIKDAPLFFIGFIIRNELQK
jgi:hypothetical protein